LQAAAAAPMCGGRQRRSIAMKVQIHYCGG